MDAACGKDVLLLCGRRLRRVVLCLFRLGLSILGRAGLEVLLCLLGGKLIDVTVAYYHRQRRRRDGRERNPQ